MSILPPAGEFARVRELMSQALAACERDGIQPLDDLGWMNAEDREAVCAPFAAALMAYVAERNARERATTAPPEQRRVVYLRVEGGRVDVDAQPDDVEVVVRDYDTDGFEDDDPHLNTDADGRRFHERRHG